MIPDGHVQRATRERGGAQKHVYARGLTIGKVVGVFPATATVDVAAARGNILRQVPYLSDASTRAGGIYLQAITNYLPDVGAEGSLDIPANDGKRSLFAVVGYVEGNPDQPVVLRFLMPRVGQMRFAQAGLALWRHESDLYTAVENGAPGTYDAASETTLSNLELVASDGTLLRIGTGVTHRDYTGEDVNGLWRVRGTANATTPIGQAGPDTPYLSTVYKHPSGTAIVIDAAGNITFTLAPGATLQVAQTGETPKPLAREGDPIVGTAPAGGGSITAVVGTPTSSVVTSV